MQFKNISTYTQQIGVVILAPNAVGDLDTSDLDTLEEIEILLGSGELEVYTPPGETPQSVPSTKRTWQNQIEGGRSYNYYSTTVDRGWNTVYGSRYFQWSSAYSKTDPTRTAHGISVPVTAKLKRLTQRFRSSTAADTPVEIKVWKQKKVHNSDTVVNTLLFSKVITTNSTINQVLIWEAAELGNPTIKPDEVLFMTWARYESGANSFYYYENILLEFEETQ